MKMHNVSFFVLAPILHDKVELSRQSTFIAPFKNTAGVFWHSLLAVSNVSYPRFQKKTYFSFSEFSQARFLRQ